MLGADRRGNGGELSISRSESLAAESSGRVLSVDVDARLRPEIWRRRLLIKLEARLGLERERWVGRWVERERERERERDG